MDPDYIWETLVESLKKLRGDPENPNERIIAINALDVLMQWLQLGGFPPTITKEKQ